MRKFTFLAIAVIAGIGFTAAPKAVAQVSVDIGDAVRLRTTERAL